MTRPVVAGMVQRGFGRIVNISSVNGQQGQFGQANYSAAKAGLHGFTMAVAREVESGERTLVVNDHWVVVVAVGQPLFDPPAEHAVRRRSGFEPTGAFNIDSWSRFYDALRWPESPTPPSPSSRPYNLLPRIFK